MRLIVLTGVALLICLCASIISCVTCTKKLLSEPSPECVHGSHTICATYDNCGGISIKKVPNYGEPGT